MKDAYSFHSSDEDFVKYYEAMKKVYLRIFERI
jgi:prolyl-tRNA synthetase